MCSIHIEKYLLQNMHWTMSYYLESNSNSGSYVSRLMESMQCIPEELFLNKNEHNS